MSKARELNGSTNIFSLLFLKCSNYPGHNNNLVKPIDPV